MQLPRPKWREVENLASAQHLKKTLAAVSNRADRHLASPRLPGLDEVHHRVVRLLRVAHFQVLDPRSDLHGGLGSHVTSLQGKTQLSEASF